MLKAVWFDMDDTLLSINLGAFVYMYVKDQSMLLASIARKNLFAMSAQFSAAYLSMFDEGRTDDLTNAAWLEAEIERRCGVPVSDPVVADVFSYYEREVLPARNNRVVAARPREGADRALARVLDGGYRCALVTNPSFTRECIECRMRWGGIDGVPFEHVTHMGNSTRCKPSARYYRENLERMGLATDEVLMVGNDPKRDFPSPDCGIRTAYVGAGEPERALWCGDMEGFARDFDKIVELFERDVEASRGCPRDDEEDA